MPSVPTFEAPPAAQARRPLQPVLTALSAVVVLIAICFLWLTRHWPMVGDARLIRYDTLLISHGFAPYRDFQEINFPGCFAVDALVRHLFGPSSAAWRFFDALLILLTGGILLALFGIRRWQAAIIAAVLFAVAHWGDGIAQLAQRDLQVSVLLLMGVVCFYTLSEKHPVVGASLFGLAHGCAFTIKPNGILVTIACGAVLILVDRGVRRRRLLLVVGAATGAFALPLAVAVGYLAANQALSAFFVTARVLLPFHASLARRSLGYLLTHVLAPFSALVGIWVAAQTLRRKIESTNRLRMVLGSGALGGLAMYISQGKGLPYHRYPFLMFLLPLLVWDFEDWLGSGPIAARVLSCAALLIGALVIAPMSLARATHFVPHDSFGDALSHDLQAFDQQALNGRVQCLDSVQGCIATLDRLALVQSTGVIYDEFLFGNATKTAVQDSRLDFLRAVDAKPPKVVVLVDSFFLDGTTGYRKLSAWPEFQSWLDQNYRIRVDRPSPGVVRWWGRPQPAPGYRLYVLREPTALAEPAPR